MVRILGDLCENFGDDEHEILDLGKIYMDISQHKNLPLLNLDFFCRFKSKSIKKFGDKK